MKKRILALLLAVCIAVSIFALPTFASGSANTAVQTAVTLGAMEQSQTAALNAAVTRGAFARMLTAFSAYRDSVKSQGTPGTLFKDVPSSSELAPYIRIAVQQGWMNGYTDGSFRPDNVITLEAASTAVLKLLGYKMTDLSGTYPDAQLNKASSLKLFEDIYRKQGEAMNYEECAILLYNSLTAENAEGSVYGTTLGFTVTDGQVDVSTVMISSQEGPFVAKEGEQLPFTPTSIYRNDKASNSAELNAYDVYYYSENLQTVWIYTRRAAGRITAVAPSASAPTSVTVSGNTYVLGSSAVASQISSLNGGGVGQVVTLLLGRNNVVAGIVTGEKEADSVYYGVVTSSTRELVDEDDSADVLQTVTAMCTDGISRKVNVDKSVNYPVGWLVEISVNGSGEDIHAIDTRTLDGEFNEENGTIGEYAMADDIEILDTTSGGTAGTISPSRLSGTYLSLLNVRYFTQNSSGQVDRLILSDVTGDLWNYVVLDDVKNLALNLDETTALIESLVDTSAYSSSTASSISSTRSALSSELYNVLVPTTNEILWGVISGDLVSTVWDNLTTNTGSLLSIGVRGLATMTGMPFSTLLNYAGSGATYICQFKGQTVYYSTSFKYPVVAGAIGISTEGLSSSKVEKMAQLMPTYIDKIGAVSVMSGDTRYEMADDVQVYLWYKGQYYYTKLTSVNTDDYYLTGWYDNFGCAAGKKVRIIIAVKKD